MEIDYIRETGAVYLRIISESDSLIKRRMKMVTSNNMEGMAAVTCRCINNREQYLYNISSTIPLSQYFEKTEMKKTDVMKLAEGIQTAVKTLERYLLDVGGLMLDPAYIFYDSSSNCFKFCYFAGNDVEMEESLKTLFEYVIGHVCHSDAEAVTLAYGMYKRICTGNVDFGSLTVTETSPEIRKPEVIEEYTPVKDILPELAKEEHEEKDKTKIYCIYGAGAALALIFVYGLAGIFIKDVRINGIGAAVYIFICVVSGISMYMGYKWYEKNKDSFVKIVTDTGCEPYRKKSIRIIVPENKEPDEMYTVVLNGSEPAQDKKHCLKWDDPAGQQVYELKEDVCIIGSAPDRADCCISRPGVSRIHARITREGDAFYIKDMNSTNGTKVNERELGCFELCEISSGDNIIIGSVKCVFV